MQLSIKLSKNRTLRESIVDAIRTSILKGQLKPGIKISEPTLATQFGISRTPVREALRQLDSEGFLQVIPRRGARVAPLSEKDIHEFYEIKAVLEGYAARLAVSRITDKEIDKMHHLNAEMEKANQAQDYRRVFRLHNEFHEVFLRSCGNEHLHQLIHMLVMKFQRFRIMLAVSGKSEDSIAQHWDIIAALRERDAEKAARLVAENANLGKEVIIREILSAMQ